MVRYVSWVYFASDVFFLNRLLRIAHVQMTKPSCLIFSLLHMHRAQYFHYVLHGYGFHVAKHRLLRIALIATYDICIFHCDNLLFHSYDGVSQINYYISRGYSRIIFRSSYKNFFYSLLRTMICRFCIRVFWRNFYLPKPVCAFPIYFTRHLAVVLAYYFSPSIKTGFQYR